MATDTLSGLEDAAWRGFLLTHDRLWRALEAGLATFNVSMVEYSVLALLGQAGPSGMRMSELAERRLMSTGGFTRLADRLERRGLIQRRPSADDGRGSEAVLTKEGRSLLRRAWRKQYAQLRELFFDRLDQNDLSRLADIWARLSDQESTESQTVRRRRTR